MSSSSLLHSSAAPSDSRDNHSIARESETEKEETEASRSIQQQHERHRKQEPPAPPPVDSSALLFQSFLKSRRTVSNFDTATTTPLHPDVLRLAIQRAVECARNAPNHKRTEPFTFKRLISPSEATLRLADICYEVTLRRKKRLSKDEDEMTHAEQMAQRKRERWREMPAFVVALVGGQPSQNRQQERQHSGDSETSSPPVIGEDEEYLEIPFVPPTSERQLEDYAATCAAVQNILLSLHSEGVGSKWATGPIIRTSAFRSLVQARDDEMIVGLLMIGLPKFIPKPPRRRRDVIGDVLQDI